MRLDAAAQRGQFTVERAVLTTKTISVSCRVRDSSVRQVGSGRRAWRAILPFYPEKFGPVAASPKGRKNQIIRTIITLATRNPQMALRLSLYRAGIADFLACNEYSTGILVGLFAVVAALRSVASSRSSHSAV